MTTIFIVFRKIKSVRDDIADFVAVYKTNPDLSSAPIELLFFQLFVDIMFCSLFISITLKTIIFRVYFRELKA